MKKIIFIIFILFLLPIKVYANTLFNIEDFSYKNISIHDNEYRLTAQDKNIIINSIDETLKYFENIGYPLTNHVFLTIYKNNNDFLSQIKEAGILNYGYKISGLSVNNNIYGLYNPYIYNLRLIIAHELTHQWQYQLVGFRMNNNRFLSEGYAEYVSYKIVNIKPDLTNNNVKYTNHDYEGYEDWQRACKKYGGQIMYKKANYETNKLIEELGEKKFIQYYGQTVK